MTNPRVDLSVHLEQKVIERTQQLRLKVKELEGKDRIAQHLLTVHSLDETLDVVLDVVCEVMRADRAVVYLKDGESLAPRRRLALLLRENSFRVRNVANSGVQIRIGDRQHTVSERVDAPVFFSSLNGIKSQKYS